MEKPWINAETKELIKEKNKLYSHFRKEKDITKKAYSFSNLHAMFGMIPSTKNPDTPFAF